MIPTASPRILCSGLIVTLAVVVGPASGQWQEDEFDGTDIDPAKWSVACTAQGSNSGVIEPNSSCGGSLHAAVYHRTKDYNLPLCYAESVGDEIDRPWTYYTRVKYQATAVNWTSVHVGFYFVMENGEQAFLRFDSSGCSACRLSYGSGDVAYGARLWHKVYYDLKFSWDGTALRAWYREPGRTAWLGNYAIYSSFTTYPQKVRIGQGCPACNAGTYSDVNMDMYVCYWRLTEPEPLQECFFEDEFDYTQIDPTKWSESLIPYWSNTGSLGVDGYGRLYTDLYTRTKDYAAARVWAQSKCRFPDEPWEYYSRVWMRVSPESQWNRTDVDLGFSFEMADGSKYGFVQFDGYDTGCRLKHGTGAGTNYGPRLLDGYWYDLKFAWDQNEDNTLRAWYKEWGRERWRGGYAVFGSSETYPELLRIGHRDLICPSSYDDINQYLYVDYWRLLPDPLRGLGHTSDEFNFPDIDTTKWEIRDRDYGGNDGSIFPDGVGNLRVDANVRTRDLLLPQQWIQTRNRLPDEPWTYYSMASFGAWGHGYGLNRTDASLGYRFRMVEGKDAWLEFDTSGTGCRLKYGNSDVGDVHGKTWNQWWPVELKFVWDGSELRAWYREVGREVWRGNFNLFGSTTNWPELVQIGQTRVKRPSSYDDVSERLYVEYWRLDDEPIPAPERYLCDEFTLTEINPVVWKKYDVDFGGNAGSVTIPGGYLRVQSTSVTRNAPRSLSWISALDRVPRCPWKADASARFSATASGRSDLDPGFHFLLTDGRVASLVFDSVSGTRIKYGILGALSAGPSLTSGDWYDLQFRWDGQCLTADYRLTEEDPWQGDLELACVTNAYPDRVRIGQINSRNPASYDDVSATLDVDRLCLVPLAPPLGDFDENGHVNLLDFADFQCCFAGQDQSYVEEDCAFGDLDCDYDIDLDDFAWLQSWFAQP